MFVGMLCVQSLKARVGGVESPANFVCAPRSINGMACGVLAQALIQKLAVAKAAELEAASGGGAG